ncbi:DUF1592 domain-containing protein [Roseimicrobium sp. ORNL1]|uniref:DUF1592 domain-containing protein n=1 Tax=Roseimicrobium sp. ORNL1 TaxID=2711231 RepID=UPI0013E1320B|nr:DUF1592 domain-containing protein [Roseimicrobium sp. ORNL1]QIF03251.1 DUF1592 domain-containing protein [Roseimicrobium sp. ORNL1]
MPVSRAAFPFFLSVASVVTLTLSSTQAQDRAAVADAFQKNVIPVMEQRCFDCHDGEVKKGDVDLQALTDANHPARNDIRLWDKVREQLKAGTMPPKNKTPLEPQGKQAILDWVGMNEMATLALAPSDPGVRKVRRLTRDEYTYALRDLLGIESKPGDKFPADGAGGEGFSNNADTLTLSPLLIEKYITTADDVVKEVWSKDPLRGRLMAPCTSDKLPPEEGAALILRPLVQHAWRRPVSEQELKEVIQVFSAALKRGANWDGALKVAVKTVILSPKFLFIREQEPAKVGEIHQVDHYGMASRLSFFLWSSIPDDELLKLASEKKLQDDAVLAAQVKRMLADKRAVAFTKTFAGQWLRFDELFNTVDPDRRKFPQFNDEMRRNMYDEAFNFADNILRHNGRVLDFLDSDYSYLNEALANHYGVPDVKGPEMRQVKFTDGKRGGLVGMGAILSATAYPQRTSPVLRGKWVLEQLLGSPPPPPPPNVGQLPEDDRDLKGEVTLRKRLEAHRDKAACIGCHVRMDPIGFGLENFNAVGQWRDNENGKALDVGGVMPDGRAFANPAELRKVLMQEKDKFSRTLCSRLLGYALGRGLETVDQPTLLRLEETLKKNDYRSEALIIGVVQSYPFRMAK